MPGNIFCHKPDWLDDNFDIRSVQSGTIFTVAQSKYKLFASDNLFFTPGCHTLAQAQQALLITKGHGHSSHNCSLNICFCQFRSYPWIQAYYLYYLMQDCSAGSFLIIFEDFFGLVMASISMP